MPSSVSNVNGTVFVSATSAVRSHGHRRRYQRNPKIRDRDSQVMGGKEKEDETFFNAFSTIRQEKRLRKKDREKKFNAPTDRSRSDIVTAKENRTRDTSRDLPF